MFGKRRVVDGVSLEVRQGEIVGLLGPNGAGKTTTFYMIVGLLKANGGRVLLDDQDLTKIPMYRRARAGIGYLSQEPSVFRRLTVEQNVMAILETLDLTVGGEYLHHVALGLYERAMLRGLRADVARFAGPMTDEERAAVTSARSLRQFDDAFTARQNGWRDASEYYTVNSSAQYLPHITVPTLVLHAVDDPIVPPGPYRSIDWASLERAGSVRRAITAHGGHVGFHQRDARPPWYTERAVEFFTRELAG